MKKSILLLLTISIIFSSCTTSTVTDFNSCVEAGNPVMESYPEQCSDGKNTYVKDYTNEFCGGIAAITCPPSYTCKLDGTYPDAGGICVKEN